MRQYKIDIYPENTLTVLLFKNVNNAEEIKELLQNGTLDIAIANCKPIFNHQQILIAVTKSISALSESKKPENFNINKDMINRLSPSGNYVDSLLNFGLNGEDKEFFVLLLNASNEKIEEIKSKIKGDQVDISSQTNNIYFNEEFAKKVYKISDSDLSLYASSSSSSSSNNNNNNSILQNLIINNMAVKGLL